MSGASELFHEGLAVRKWFFAGISAGKCKSCAESRWQELGEDERNLHNWRLRQRWCCVGRLIQLVCVCQFQFRPLFYLREEQLFRQLSNRNNHSVATFGMLWFTYICMSSRDKNLLKTRSQLVCLLWSVTFFSILLFSELLW